MRGEREELKWRILKANERLFTDIPLTFLVNQLSHSWKVKRLINSWLKGHGRFVMKRLLQKEEVRSKSAF